MIQIVIDIPEDIYKFVCQLSCEDSYHYDDVVLTSVKNGTPIPDNATNGDVVKTLFSDTLDSFCERTTWEWNRWWNAPYQKGGKE